MSNQIKIIIGLAVAVIVGLALIGRPTVIERVTEKLGASPGTVVTSNDFSIGGIQRFYFSSAFATATSTYCVFRMPASTSTLVSFSARLDTSTTSGTELVLATSSAAYAPQSVSAATTSELSDVTIPGGTVPPFHVVPAPTTNGTTNTNGMNATGTIASIIAPNTYLVLYVRGAGANTATAGIANDAILSAAHTGRCDAVVEQQ